jgi:parallel beta-helix repeat protein
MRILLAAIIVIIAIVGTVAVTRKPAATTQTSTTTVPIIRAGSISACKNITGPGNYFLSSNIKTGISSGACIDITASNVALVCNRHSITGSGPYSGVPPFTYGIEIYAQSNVSVSGCNIAYFSYGIYAQNSSSVSILDNNMTSDYLSDAYFSGTHNSSVIGNRMSKASSTQGALYLVNGSIDNRIVNNTIEGNRFYGIVINSTSNFYINNTLSGNPSSLYCGAASSFPYSSYAKGNTCYNNTGCSFIECKGVNEPANISTILLGSSISSCGSIRSPGTYRLASDLDTAKFVNTSNPIFVHAETPCITIAVSNTRLNCAGFSVTEAPTAILVNGNNNVTISNCSIRGSGSGIAFNNSAGVHVNNVVFTNDTFGLALNNVTSSVFSGIKSTYNKYGIYLSDALSDTFKTFDSSNNQYGIYASQSAGNLFAQGTAFNNSVIDVYASADSSNTGYDLVQQTGCGLTNAQWAGCLQYVAQSLAYYPISSCGVLRRQGNYSLTSNVINAAAMCINVEANNVEIDCNGNGLFQSITTPGPAVYINGKHNVTLNNCGVYGFTTAINVSDSTGIGIYGAVVHSSAYGISLSNVSNSTIESSAVAGPANVTIKLYNVSRSSIIGNNVSYGTGNNVGILLNGSQKNVVRNNTESINYINMEFTGNSVNNTVMNNTAELGGYADYVCNGGNGGIASENGGINYGVKKMGCIWLAALTQGSPQVRCEVALQPDLYSLTSDEEYGYGNACYSIYANGTTINCNGHTVIATDGGTFALFRNVTNGRIINCTLKGFTNPIVASNSMLIVQNNRIYDNSSTGAAVSLRGISDSRILSNNITAAYEGISIVLGASSSLLNNIVALAATAYQAIGSTGLNIQNNTATNSSGTGFLLSNTTASALMNNRFMAKKGMVCLNSSQGGLSNIDNGGNMCSSNSGCNWFKGVGNGCAP